MAGVGKKYRGGHKQEQQQGCFCYRYCHGFI